MFPGSAHAGDFTIVIDPGHGGKDFGATGATAREKDINLAVALLLGDLIEKNMDDVDIVFTRKNDTFVTLQGRADIANKAEGDLFVSIHTNSVDKKNRNRANISGASVYTLGLRRFEDNLEVAKRENAVMMLESDYTTTYQGFDPNSTESYIMFEMNQSKHLDHSIMAAQDIQNELISTANRMDRGVRQAVFWVLVKTSMPAILVELDFICNPVQEKYMSSKKGQQELAEAIFRGFKAYKASADHERSGMAQNKKKPRKPKTNPTKENKIDSPQPDRPADSGDNGPTQQPSENVIIYKVQFLTAAHVLSNNDRELKGLKGAEYYIDGKMVKYTYGSTPSLEEANKILKEIKNKFPDAFVIKTMDGKRVK